MRLPTVPESVAHRIAFLDAVPTGDLLIHEIYRSLQGESTFAGLPCVFVRTTGCSLRCKWCDTAHAFKHGERMTRPTVVARVLEFDCPLVEVTGGEPLEQPEVLPLLAELCDAGKTVLIETSGAHDVGGIDPRVQIIMDLKCPDSGEEYRNFWPNLDRLKPTDQIKFVVASRHDWDWTAATISRHRLDQRFQVLVSTAFAGVTPQELAEWLLASGLNVRMQLQMHKYIWAPSTRGV